MFQVAGQIKNGSVAVDELIDARKSIVYRRRIKLTENRKIHRDVLFGERLIGIVKQHRRILLCGQNRRIGKVVLCQLFILVRIVLVRARRGGCRGQDEQRSKDDCQQAFHFLQIYTSILKISPYIRAFRLPQIDGTHWRQSHFALLGQCKARGYDYPPCKE